MLFLLNNPQALVTKAFDWLRHRGVLTLHHPTELTVESINRLFLHIERDLKEQGEFASAQVTEALHNPRERKWIERPRPLQDAA